MSIGVLFSGFGGVDTGARAAGLELAWGVEYDPQIAAVANANLGNHVKVANLLDCDPFDFESVDVLHASPPCPNFSVANAKSGETELDIALGCKVASFVSVLRPQVFTLENVWAYRLSHSWQRIEAALHKAGYWVSVEHANFADYGVPQTRKRMIVRAIRGGFVPYLPEPQEWVGWYSAIEDLLPSLPDSQFAPWQLERLPEVLKANFVMQVQGEAGDGVRWDTEPMQTVAANHGAGKYRAFLVENVNTSRLATVRSDGEHRFTITADDRPSHRPMALLFAGDNTSNGLTVRDGDSRTITVTASDSKHPMRAWLVNESSSMEVRGDQEPAACQVASGRNANQRALLDIGRVVAMTPRALARFQSFPDWYELPDNARLAAKGIGNAVPPLAYQRIIEGLETEKTSVNAGLGIPV